MTDKVNRALKEWFEGYVDRFRDGDSHLCPPLELKLAHSRRVAENAKLIAAALDWSQGERRLAEGAGLVHDVGRFPQYREYGSFMDADTVDHGAYGRNVLEQETAAHHLSPGDSRVLLCAVQYHNRHSSDIPPRLGVKQRRLLNCIRDADKLDVMDLVLQSVAADGFRELPNMLPRISLSRDISPRILTEAIEMKTVSISNLATVGDYLVMLAVWFYDLNYPPTKQLAVERKILDRIRHELPETDIVGSLIDHIRASI